MARLREVLREEELVALRDCMGGYLPYSAGVHGFLDVTLKCQVLPFGDSKVYIPEGSQFSTLVVVAPSCSQTYIQNITVFWDTEKEDDENVIRLLKTVPGWDWTAPVYYRVTPLSVFAKLQTYLKNERLGNGGMWCQMVIKGPLFTIEDSDIRQMKIPEGFSLDSLRPEDAPAVISPWHYSWTESHQGVELLLARLPSVAIRHGSEAASKAPVGGRLVSWCSLHNLCFLGNAFTVPGHRRKGLGTAVALAMVQKLRQKGIPVRSIVERSNTASVRFHESLGFKERCDMVLFIMLPRGKTLEDFIPKKTVQSEVK
ncbi:uncharacterized protein LOC122246718 isoform X2 [Penaeus japonicus]|uniref:uncharacterized protein LOC122246718 isoform X2 n=1 Tax=Penaeus japonicus TaxID=27405 RepID=UPI001C70ECF7|nr:uncharacterized protein LOC122246718 isoform X2 [Penaeus japonicus]